MNDIVGISPTANNGGYFLVGKDGGVFAFGDAPLEGSLPGLGTRVNNIVGLAASTTNQGYWIVGSDGHVYAFGDEPTSVALPVQPLPFRRRRAVRDTGSPDPTVGSSPSETRPSKDHCQA